MAKQMIFQYFYIRGCALYYITRHWSHNVMPVWLQYYEVIKLRSGRDKILS